MYIANGSTTSLFRKSIDGGNTYPCIFTIILRTESPTSARSVSVPNALVISILGIRKNFLFPSSSMNGTATTASLISFVSAISPSFFVSVVNPHKSANDSTVEELRSSDSSIQEAGTLSTCKKIPFVGSVSIFPY